MIRAFFLVMIAAITMSLSNCEQKETIVAADITSLTGEWRLAEPASAYEITLKLEVDPTASTIPGVTPLRIAGKSSVNQYFASAAAGTSGEPKNSFGTGTIGATKMAGPAEAMQFETRYFESLKDTKRFELTSANRLKLYYDGTRSGVLIYEKVK